jgi:hypothetical protein
MVTVDRSVLRRVPVDGGCMGMMIVDGSVHVVPFLVEVLTVLVPMQVMLLMRCRVGCNWMDEVNRSIEGLDMVLRTTGR